MRISNRFHLIYFSIPKTGSEAVRSFLDPVSEEKIVKFPDVDAITPFHSHMRPFEAARVFGEKGWTFDAYFRIATVRNPWSRLASLYKMVCRNRGEQWAGSFSDWIQTLDPTGRSTSHMPEKWYAHGTMSMTRFLSDLEGRIMVDQVFRIEDQIDAMHHVIKERVGAHHLQHPVGHKNKADQPYDWRSMYTVRDRKSIAELYSDDIERFGYTFDMAT